ncbi:hypothetical protein FRC12_011622 [Ceratobasidium sp. 428]|nr:hypothetical protein FRC12_011622 [Ceratobasidium sp. 428]
MPAQNKHKQAYIMVIPAPGVDSLGIECINPLNQSTRFMFWIKIGDTSRAEPVDRIKEYKNPSQRGAIIQISDPDTVSARGGNHGDAPGAGKQLERESGLINYESGGLGQTDGSEWHALYVNDSGLASALSLDLEALLDRFDVPGPRNTLGTQKCRTYSDTLEIIKSYITKVDPTAKKNREFFEQTPMVHIVVVPSIHPKASNKGYLVVKKLEPDEIGKTFHRYWVHFGKTITVDATPYQLASARYITENPDFAYNAFRTEKDDAKQKVLVERSQKLVNGWLKAANVPEFPNDFNLFTDQYEDKEKKKWYYFDVDSNSCASVSNMLAAFVDSFHNRDENGKLKADYLNQLQSKYDLTTNQTALVETLETT